MSSIGQKIKAVVCKAILKAIQQDGSHTVVILKNETRKAWAPQPYGLRTRPPTGSKQVVLFPNGEKDEGLVAVSDNPEGCPELTENEVAVYSKHGNLIHLLKTGDFLVVGSIDQTGDFTSSGQVSDLIGTMLEIRQLYNTHTHNETGVVTLAPNQQMPVV